LIAADEDNSVHVACVDHRGVCQAPRDAFSLTKQVPLIDQQYLGKQRSTILFLPGSNCRAYCVWLVVTRSKGSGQMDRSSTIQLKTFIDQNQLLYGRRSIEAHAVTGRPGVQDVVAGDLL
jgi:hypothetical protein